jgi:hypothetical protein
MRKITMVKVLQGYRLELTFDNGVSGAVDLSDLDYRFLINIAT